jgi:molybdopterin converting factor small subunit
MQINIIIFGKLKDITGAGSFQITGVNDTNEMVTLMNNRFPALAAMQYAIAVGKDIITDNTSLRENDTVALLPPYSGG